MSACSSIGRKVAERYLFTEVESTVAPYRVVAESEVHTRLEANQIPSYNGGNAFLVDAPTFAWLMPFAVPSYWRRMLATMAQMQDRSLRLIGFASSA